MKEFWNDRFGQQAYIYGKAPNTFFAEWLVTLNAGNLLLPAEGEGRNAVYAALKGWKVTAFDYSEEGKKKALALAESQNVAIDYLLVNADQYVSNISYDAVAMIYAHFAGTERAHLCKQLEVALVKGGHMMMEVFSKDQLGRSSGGPKSLDLLYSIEEIKTLFTNIDFSILEEKIVLLDEGAYHQGKAVVIRAVGTKR